MSANAASPSPKAEAPTANAIVTPDQSKAKSTKHKKKTGCGPFSIKSQKKSGVLYLRSMDSPTSVFAAVNKYKSITDALHTEANSEHQTNSDFRSLALHHFGTCDKFRNDFEVHINNATSPYFSKEVPKQSVLESSFHKSVRHICFNACFLRAYAPIRDHCFLWRDLAISNSDQSAADLTKDRVLNEWICQLTKPQLEPNATNRQKKQPKGKAPSICPTIFVSNNAEEFSTRSKVEKHLNNVYTDSPESFLRTDITSVPTNNLLNGCITSINPLYSPLGLLEELFLDDPWRLLVSTILLNKTQRPQVDCIFFQFLQKWPDALSTSLADEEKIFNVIGVLGLGNKRSKSLIRFSKEYLELIESKRSALADDDTKLLSDEDPKPVEYTLSMKEVKSLHQCGVYAWTAYQLFILKELPEGDSFEVCDHALQLYVEYKLGVHLWDEKSERHHSQAVGKKKRKRGEEVDATDENRSNGDTPRSSDKDKPRRSKKRKKKKRKGTCK
ncbi:hypothetical protein ACHAXN_001873 [Cyclotella atomus]